MNRRYLFAGGSMNFAPALFKTAMPNLFDWREAMAASAESMWKILYSENLGISLLLLFFAYMSVFQWEELLGSGLGKTVMLSISVMWTYRAGVEIFSSRSGRMGLCGG